MTSSACLSLNSVGKRSRLRIATYVCQVTAIFIIIVACIVNLSLNSDKEALWSSLLGSAIGYLLPAPKLKDDALLSNPSLQLIDDLLPGQHSNALHDEIASINRVDGRVGSGISGDIVSEIVVHDN